MRKVLIVDDDVALCKGLQSYLAEKSLLVEVANSGEDALQLLSMTSFDLIILDWMLPGMTGLDVCKALRKSGNETYIIFLTGESDVDNIEQGLQTGGDDYLTKPFDTRELFARINTVFRRAKAIVDAVLTIRGVSLDTVSRVLTFDEQSLQLTPKEADLLAYLMRNANRPFNANKLLSALWSSESEVTAGTVRTSLHNLRQKLKTLGQEEFVKSIAAAGYVVENR